MKIALKNISKTFGELKALDAVSFEVREGECFFLLGPSGCGKTTVLRIIAGFCPSDAGTIFFDKKEVNNLPPHLRNTGMVFQNYALWPHLTVAENIVFGLTVPAHQASKTERARRLREMINLLHLEGTEKRLPSELSGGQQQRVALARALVVKPACLLLDEPLSNLDARLRVEMRLEIKHIIKTLGITAVYVTHDQTEALSMADRCAIMRVGRIEQIGAPRELYEQPANRFIADFLGCANLLDAKIVSQDSNALCLATTAGNWLSRSCRGPFPAGTEIAIAVRPEKVRFGEWPVNTPNVFPGRLKEEIYLGAAVEYRIALNGGLVIRALRTDTDSSAAGMECGQQINIAVDPADVIVLPVE